MAQADHHQTGIRRDKKGSSVSVVIPCFNEQDNIDPLYRALSGIGLGLDSEIIFVNDGSGDATVSKIQLIRRFDSRVKLLSLIRNYGQQVALRAGIHHATGDFIITLDADLQHPPRYIPQMIETARMGYDVVVMARQGNQKGLFKQFSSNLFYWLFAKVSGVKLEPCASDFRLITRTVQKVIMSLPERNVFFRALIPSLGFKSATLAYELEDRFSGRASYTFSKSLKLAKDSLFNYSTVPIKICFNIGILSAGLAFLYGIFQVLAKFLTDWNIPGFTDIIASVLFLGGLNLAVLSIIAKYIHVTMEHVKGRPEYIVDASVSDLPEKLLMEFYDVSVGAHRGPGGAAWAAGQGAESTID